MNCPMVLLTIHGYSMKMLRSQAESLVIQTGAGTITELSPEEQAEWVEQFEWEADEAFALGLTDAAGNWIAPQ